MYPTVKKRLNVNERNYLKRMNLNFEKVNRRDNKNV